ncbi:MAG: acetylxylan esterase [Planctomycetota bacterium]|nr:acetylxylan esterase [Planctomycetota bacterium]MDA1212306.1 acetylxylan esterase [Planctomycetota bacterium]
MTFHQRTQRSYRGSGQHLCVWAALFCCLSLQSTSAADAPVWRVMPDGAKLADARLEKHRDLQDKVHPWTPPETRTEWEQQSQEIRQRLLVSNGLWPMWPKEALSPVIHGKIDRGDYTVEKVYFASLPGHYVTGNLYRPKVALEKYPAVLCPHGHWPQGRFYDSGEGFLAQLTEGAEEHAAGAHYPLQARMASLARMGCIVFHYDMVGYADSTAIVHRQGFTDLDAALKMQNFMGLQTFNSMRALDFLLSLPDVDTSRVGVTGASGGGTQTFMLCALDDRPVAAFPAVMVSTEMQGGCVCENAEYLRIGINNIAIAALFAPKPMALSGANDWTLNIENSGLPELKQVYDYFGVPELVDAKCFPQFGHNYNQVAREMMYAWFNQHLQLGQPETPHEQDFWPIDPQDLSVFDNDHPLPSDSTDAAGVRKYLTNVSSEQYQSLLPNSKSDIGKYQEQIGVAARVMLDEGVPPAEQIEKDEQTYELSPQLSLIKGTMGRSGTGEQLPYLVLLPEDFSGTAVLWFDTAGKRHLFDDEGRPIAAVQKLIDEGHAVASADVFMTGEYLSDGQDVSKQPVNETYQGYTFGYNKPWLSQRVRDILTMVGAAVHHPDVKTVHLVGTGDAGLWTLLARSVAGDTVSNTIVESNGFAFGNISSTNDANILPGALKYGGVGGLAALAAPAPLYVAQGAKIPEGERKPLEQVYEAAGGKLTLDSKSLTPEHVTKLLLQ